MLVKPLKNLILKYREFILYGIIGCGCATFDFIVYTLILCVTNGQHLLIANAIGVSCGIIASFLLNRKYNFKVKDKSIRRFVCFFCVGLIGLLISSFLIVFLIDNIVLSNSIAKLCTIFIVSVIQFLLNKFITFKTTQNECREDIYSNARV